MKNIFTIFIIFFISIASFAQNKKNSIKSKTATSSASKIEIAAVAGYDIAKPFKKAATNNNLNGSFYVGYFVSPKYEIGIRGSKSFGNTSPSMGFGVFARRYFNEFYAGLGANNALFTFNNQDAFGNTYKTYRNITSGNLETGYRFEVSKKFKLETGLNCELFLDKSSRISSAGYGARVGIVYGF